MGYKVEYPSDNRVRNLDLHISRIASLSVFCFLLFLLLTSFFWPRGMAVLNQLIFPGDMEIITAAFSNLTEDLRSGSELYNSLKNFCIRVLEGV